MAPQGKKKKDDRDGTAKKGRAAGAPSAPRERRAATEPDAAGDDRAPRAAATERRGGVNRPGQNLIGPGAELDLATDADEPAAVETAPAELGATRYVHAAFFLAGILVAFLAGKILALGWNLLAEWHAAVAAMPFLLRFGEGQRTTITGLIGVLVGLVAVIQTYRREGIRRWADEVAAELARVTWPTKETVTNGTVVVIVASIVATVYVTLLDQFWGFVTRLIYEA